MESCSTTSTIAVFPMSSHTCKSRAPSSPPAQPDHPGLDWTASPGVWAGLPARPGRLDWTGYGRAGRATSRAARFGEGKGGKYQRRKETRRRRRGLYNLSDVLPSIEASGKLAVVTVKPVLSRSVMVVLGRQVDSLNKRSLDLLARCERANIYRVFSHMRLSVRPIDLVRKEP
jgi:hypothetical protein